MAKSITQVEAARPCLVLSGATREPPTGVDTDTVRGIELERSFQRRQSHTNTLWLEGAKNKCHYVQPTDSRSLSFYL